MQTELLNRRKWNTRFELAGGIFEYLEIFHNRSRRHSSLGMLTPVESSRHRLSSWIQPDSQGNGSRFGGHTDWTSWSGAGQFTNDQSRVAPARRSQKPRTANAVREGGGVLYVSR